MSGSCSTVTPTRSLHPARRSPWSGPDQAEPRRAGDPEPVALPVPPEHRREHRHRGHPMRAVSDRDWAIKPRQRFLDLAVLPLVVVEFEGPTAAKVGLEDARPEPLSVEIVGTGGM